LKKYKSPSSDQIPAELSPAGGETLLSATQKLVNSACSNKDMSIQWKTSIIAPIYKIGD
jgi:hypothetical protein